MTQDNTLSKKIFPYISGAIYMEFFVDKEERKQGLEITYNENGKVLKQCTYLNNKLHGSYQSFFTDGAIESKKNYINGKLHGIIVDYLSIFSDRMKTPTIKYYDNGKEVEGEANIKHFLIKERFKQNQR